MTAFNGYPFSVFLALLLHGLLIGTLLWMQRANSDVIELVRPQAVKAILVEENPQARNERAAVEQQRREEEARRQEQLREEQRRQEEEAQRQEEQRRQEEEARRQEEARQAALREQQEQERIEQERREQERLEEQRRQEEEARRREEQRQREEEARRQEEARQAEQQSRLEAEARERAETESEMVAAYSAVIHDLVQQNWSRPPSARNNMEAVLRISMVPTGDVVNVEIVRSSGDPAFDRSAENAVRAVGRFSELQGMPPRMFERSFRSFLLTFRPEDLLN